MSPILVRPVREQLEHDRVIRLLQAKYKRKFDVAINPGSVQATPVLIGPSPWYPDLVLLSTDRTRKPVGTVEVETAESVNHLEAMSQWAAFGRLRSPFHLYVPSSSVDSARRLCADHQIPVAEIWAFSAAGDQIRFALVHRSARASEAKARELAQRPAKVASRPAGAKRSVGASGAKPSKRPVAPPARSKAPARKSTAKTSAARPARPARPASAKPTRKRK